VKKYSEMTAALHLMSSEGQKLDLSLFPFPTGIFLTIDGLSLYMKVYVLSYHACGTLG